MSALFDLHDRQGLCVPLVKGGVSYIRVNFYFIVFFATNNNVVRLKAERTSILWRLYSEHNHIVGFKEVLLLHI